MAQNTYWWAPGFHWIEDGNTSLLPVSGVCLCPVFVYMCPRHALPNSLLVKNMLSVLQFGPFFTFSPFDSSNGHNDLSIIFWPFYLMPTFTYVHPLRFSVKKRVSFFSLALDMIDFTTYYK